jgi:hypothetical protein
VVTAILHPFSDAIAGDAELASRFAVFNNVLSNVLKYSPNVLFIILKNCDLPLAPEPVKMWNFSPNNLPDNLQANVFKTYTCTSSSGNMGVSIQGPLLSGVVLPYYVGQQLFLPNDGSQTKTSGYSSSITYSSATATVSDVSITRTSASYTQVSTSINSTASVVAISNLNSTLPTTINTNGSW